VRKEAGDGGRRDSVLAVGVDDELDAGGRSGAVILHRAVSGLAQSWHECV
jgi:hypothetical protein